MGKLETKYGDLVVIGVQSPKYPAEGVPQNLRHAVQRLGIRHPVVDDPDYRVWESYAVTAWPTLVFLSPDGRVIGRHAGEAPFDALDGVLTQMVAEYDRAGLLSHSPLDLGIEPFNLPLSQLSFPGKVLATDRHLFIADSGHNRIVVAGVEGNVGTVVGSGQPGLRDGDAASARFHSPQGLALDSARSLLYVADSENHAIRAIDLQSGQVSTIAGTGQQAYRAARRGPALQTALSSPWDVALGEEMLFIAMAGTHQVWTFDRDAGTVGVWAGTGHEGIRDGGRESAWLAQPMGLALHGGSLYVSCSETQAIRQIDLESGRVGTLIGQGLFDFGDVDGSAADSRLQHCQGVAAGDGSVWIADTYNNKIKALDLQASTVRTILGSGQPGELDGPGAGARLDEPSGISLRGDTLYIADTNNHAVRCADLESGHVRTLTLTGL